MHERIYLPTFQRSIILRANEGYNKCTKLFTQLDNLWRGKHYLCLYIYNMQILYRFFSISPDKTSRYCSKLQYKYALYVIVVNYWFGLYNMNFKLYNKLHVHSH